MFSIDKYDVYSQKLILIVICNLQFGNNMIYLKCVVAINFILDRNFKVKFTI